MALVCASAEIIVRGERKSIYGIGCSGLAHELLDALEKCSACGVQDFNFITLFDLDFVLSRPIAEICDVRAVPKFCAKAAAPADEVLGMDVSRRWRCVK